MQGNRIIAIGRQYGSGGHEIGRRVASRLGYGFYDKELLNMAAEKAGLHPDVVRQSEEHRTNSLLYSVVMGHTSPRGVAPGPMNLPITDQVFLVQSQIIQELAKKENCVIIGRCADYVLRDNPGMLSVFIHADFDVKVERCKQYYGIDEQEARDRIKKNDKRRANYHNFFADRPWGNIDSYHIALDTGVFGVDGCVDLIVQAVLKSQKD